MGGTQVGRECGWVGEGGKGGGRRRGEVDGGGGEGEWGAGVCGGGGSAHARMCATMCAEGRVHYRTALT